MRERLFHERYTIALAIVAVFTFVCTIVTVAAIPDTIVHQWLTLVSFFSTVSAIILYTGGEIKRYRRYKKMVKRYGYL